MSCITWASLVKLVCTVYSSCSNMVFNAQTHMFLVETDPKIEL
jgi:hypothetical protein